MGSSGGSLETSASTRAAAFAFSSQFPTSFTDLLNGPGDEEDECRTRLRQAGRGFSDREPGGLAGGGVPKFKSVPPPSLPISPRLMSPSSYFALPAGLSPAELLDSPVLLPSSNVSFWAPLSLVQYLLGFGYRISSLWILTCFIIARPYFFLVLFSFWEEDVEVTTF